MKVEIKRKLRINPVKAAVVLLLLLVVSVGCAKQKSELIQSEKAAELKPSNATDESIEVASSAFVHVCGAVERPGVYELLAGSRIYQAIEMAGGFSAEAALTSVNQAELVTDGQQIRVPTVAEASLEPEAVAGETKSGININHADSTQLMQLSGIGESRALDIINYREQNGPFSSIEEIQNISGIGTKIYEKIKNEITVN